jgi:hypothetical protein
MWKAQAEAAAKASAPPAPVTEESVPDAVLDSAIAKREALRADARAVLGDEAFKALKPEDLAPDALRKRVLAHVSPKLKLDSFDAKAIDAMFTGVVAGAKAARAKSTTKTDGVERNDALANAHKASLEGEIERADAVEKSPDDVRWRNTAKSSVPLRERGPSDGNVRPDHLRQRACDRHRRAARGRRPARRRLGEQQQRDGHRRRHRRGSATGRACAARSSSTDEPAADATRSRRSSPRRRRSSPRPVPRSTASWASRPSGRPATSPSRSTAHADWNDTDAIVKGLDAYGRPQQEVFKIPEGGNVTLTGALHFSQVTSVELPPGTSTNGTVDVGLGVSIGPLNGKALGVSIYNPAREPGTFAQYEGLSAMRKGRIKVASETAVVEQGPVYVRVVAAGAEVRGAFRGSADANDCALLDGARWVSTTSGAGIAELEINLPS